MVLLFLQTRFQDEKIIVAKDLNWNKRNSGFKSMLFCECQAQFSTHVFSLFNFAEFASMANLVWVVVKLATQANSASIWAFTSDPWSITPETGWGPVPNPCVPIGPNMLIHGLAMNQHSAIADPLPSM